MKLKNRRLILGFRFYALLDVLFSRRFELTTYHENRIVKIKTRFDKDEILNANLKYE